MVVKTSFRDSKPRTGRVSVGKARSSGSGGESMYSNDKKRVSVGKTRSSGNGDDNEEERGRRSIKGKSSRTERDPSSQNEVKDSKPRKGRVGMGKARSSGNDGESMYSNDRKRVSVGKTRSFGSDDENVNSKNQRGRRSMEGHKCKTERNDLSSRNERLDTDSREKMKVRGGKQGMKSRGNDGKKDMGNDQHEVFPSENVSTKRKRVYANQTLGDETSTRTSMKNELKRRLSIEKHMGKDKFEKSGAGSSLAVQKKHKGSGVVDKKTSLADSTKKSANKKVKANNVADNDNAEALKPKKKKRMRIDPYDFSNKKIDDSLITNKDAEEKKKDLPKASNDVELSVNAQFRAIRPSQSILSYVEDNLLGRRREIEIKRAGYNIDLSVPLDNIPFSTSSERERIEEPAFRNKLEFFAAAKISSSFPPLELPEIAFAGRSNVGKSSMLNALTRQWGVARTSDKPGLTQTINFFKLASKLCLVDLPGYGFAYAKEEVKESWEELVKEYVSTRVGLKRVCLLVDTKWGMKQRDYELIELMERSKTKYQIVLTKTDLVFPIDVARRAMQIEENLKGMKSAVQPAIMVSSKSGAGIRSFRTALSKIARFIKP